MYQGESSALSSPIFLSPHFLWLLIRKPVLLIVSFFCFAAPTFGACNITLRWDDDPPYFMVQEDEVVGIDVDLAREAMRRLGCELTLEKLPWARALVELREGRVDMLSGAYRTPEREKYAHYSAVVGLVSPNLLFIRPLGEESFDFRGLRALLESDFRLGAQIGVSYSDEYATLVQNPDYEKNIQYLSRRESLWRMLARNRIDGVIASKLTGIYEIRELGLGGRIVPSSLVVSDQPAYFMFSRKSVDADFVSDFDLVLQSMLEDGTYEIIVNRHVCALGGDEQASGNEHGACPLAVR